MRITQYSVLLKVSGYHTSSHIVSYHIVWDIVMQGSGQMSDGPWLIKLDLVKNFSKIYYHLGYDICNKRCVFGAGLGPSWGPPGVTLFPHFFYWAYESPLRPLQAPYNL
jgi:hypothetical protein